MHKFVFLIDKELKTYHNYEEIPENFDHIIEFLPEIPNSPHSNEDHEEIESWNAKLQLLIAKERKKHGY